MANVFRLASQALAHYFIEVMGHYDRSRFFQQVRTPSRICLRSFRMLLLQISLKKDGSDFQ